MAKATKPKRKDVKAELARETLSKRVPKTVDLCILGSGAAGISAAIAAAEAGVSVSVLEMDIKPFSRILATGNGRCNFSTVSLEPKRYNNKDFVDTLFGKNPLDTILNFFKDSGLRWDLEEDRLYPMSRQAASVRNVLLARAKRAGVEFFCLREVFGIKKVEDSWQVLFREPSAFDTSDLQECKLLAKSVVVATGSVTSWLNTNNLGMDVKDFTPSLCPLSCEGPKLEALDGRRVRAMVKLIRTRFPIWQERGEILFRSFGVSGIVIFDASRRALPGDLLTLDLCPDVSESELLGLIFKFAGPASSYSVDTLAGALCGVLDPVIAAAVSEVFVQNQKVPASSGEYQLAQSLTDDPLKSLCTLIKNYPLRVLDKTQLKSAQVWQGGVDTALINSEDLSFKDEALRGLYVAGEVMDIDGDCGGFNLSWAWISGLVAGTFAASYIKTL